MEPDLHALRAFAAVAEQASFRAAADRLGVTRPAISQSIRKLEERLGIALLHRTTRSVRLTEAGARLYEGLSPALRDMSALMDEVAQLGGRPRGLLRLAVTSVAERFLSGDFLNAFADLHPEITLDIRVADENFDIVAAGFDAGVRLGELIEQDMIAVPVGGDERQLVVASPAYLAQVDVPQHPRDLTSYRCIGWRAETQMAPYRWEFSEAGQDFSVAVKPRITTNDMALMIKLAVDGGGLTIGMEESFRPYLERGELVPVLEDFCPYFPGFYLYYPSRRAMAPKLRALIDHLQAYRRKAEE